MVMGQGVLDKEMAGKLPWDSTIICLLSTAVKDLLKPLRMRILVIEIGADDLFVMIKRKTMDSRSLVSRCA